ncbi:type II secretion system protein [Thalassotalea nanhaiensis]|uniref:Type II secretion system protein n=1 Tax=Thalassotalea nanhaiensis TaxID=3065648 RepID=A0ABY9TH33_9GAMM|nr:type II secretion system protein [Colwelliaceae bacterium SQ345]
MMTSVTNKQCKGFTLIELVLVIAILGIISVGFIGVINIGSNVYNNVSNRDELISDARFAVERLNRELRDALPNSIRILANGTSQCLEFVPIKSNNVYLSLATITDPVSDAIEVVKASTPYTFINSDRVVVYPIEANDVYNLSVSKSSLISNVDTTTDTNESSCEPNCDFSWDITLANPMTFAADSPNNRLFIVAEPVSYCVINSRLLRKDDQGFLNNQSIYTDGVLMAEHIDVCNGSCLPFSYNSTKAIAQIDLSFTRNNETIFFSNGVHITNVP